jgi:hypothetical protein
MVSFRTTAIEKPAAATTCNCVTFRLDNVQDYYLVMSRSENPTFEVANYRWYHQDFSLLNKEEQSSLMSKIKNKSHGIVGIRPKLFSPDIMRSIMTLFGCAEKRHQVVCANTTCDLPPLITSRIS